MPIFANYNVTNENSFHEFCIIECEMSVSKESLICFYKEIMLPFG